MRSPETNSADLRQDLLAFWEVPAGDPATSCIVPSRLTSGLIQTLGLLLLVITGLLLRVGTPRVAPFDNAWHPIALQPELAKCPIMHAYPPSRSVSNHGPAKSPMTFVPSISTQA
jgi:hypothetical protein